MGIFRGAAKAAIAAKVIDVVRREAAKPENQRKIKELITKAQSRRSTRRP
jgi:hypothetical protein